MSTIKDVAERAGVSVKTVSRVIKNYAHITPSTRAKVESAIHDLRYEKPGLEKSYQATNADGIGMLFSDARSGYQARLNQALLKACRAAKRYLAVELFDESKPDWQGQMAAFLDRTRVESIILVPPMCDSKDLHDYLADRHINVVLISPSAPVSGASSITMDDRLAAREVVNHFIGLGHKEIGFIGGKPEHIASLLRRQGFEEALLRAGLHVNADYCDVGYFDFAKALICAEKILSGPDRPTAIFAANDDMAAAVIMAAQRLGMSVPDDLSVAGFDDTPIARTLCPELTTIAQPFDELAQAAIESMRAFKKDKSQISETKVLAHRLEIRGSSAPCARVLNYIAPPAQ